MDLNLEGILAESWDVSEDGMAYTFKLRDGIKFTDGSDFNADAVKFTMDRVRDPETAAPAAGWVSSLSQVNVIDPLMVEMKLAEPFSPFLSNLGIEYFGIISPTAVEKFGEEYGRNPVGTGPFVLQEWVSGEKITLVGNPDHQNFHSYAENKGAPKLDSLNFLNMPESQTQMAAFETGQVNMFGVPPENVRDIEDSGQYQVFRQLSAGSIWFLEYAMEPVPAGETGATFKAPFDDVRTRQAVAYAINADEMIATVMVC